MRYGYAALLMLISSAVAASAQGSVRVTAPELDVSGGPLGFAAQDPNARAAALAQFNKQLEARVSPDEVVARLMSFDRNADGRVATDELSERMQAIVVRGDRSGDGALDAVEIRLLAQSPQQLPTLFRSVQGGGYSFGDSVGLSTRTHIDNTIDDLRLAPQATEQAKRIASTFTDELDATAVANLRRAVAPSLTASQLTEFEGNLTRGGRILRLTASNGSPTQTFTIGVDPAMLLVRYQLTPEQRAAATAAAETFKADQQFDDARRSALVSRLSGILTDEERDNFSAALARRPLVKGPGALASVEAVRMEFPGNGVPVREIGFTTNLVAPTSR